MRGFRIALFALGLAACAWAQQAVEPPVPANDQRTEGHRGSGAGSDIGHGAGDVGIGAAKGTGAAAKGVGQGALDLATLHPVDAAASVGKGAVVAGKDVGVGSAKGAGKITRGIGKALKKLF